jgi:hypothetical protein
MPLSPRQGGHRAWMAGTIGLFGIRSVLCPCDVPAFSSSLVYSRLAIHLPDGAYGRNDRL